MNNVFLTRPFALMSCMRQHYRTLALTWQARPSHISCTCLRARKSLTNVRSFEVSSSLHRPFCLEAPSFSSRHRSLHPSGKRPRDVLISFHLDPFSPTSCLSCSSSSLLHLPCVCNRQCEQGLVAWQLHAQQHMRPNTSLPGAGLCTDTVSEVQRNTAAWLVLV